MDTNPLVHLLRSAAALSHLVLAGCHVTDELVTAVSLVSSLRRLNLNDCSTISSKGVSALQTLTKLEFLDISWCNAVDDAGLVPTLSKLIHLQELKLAQVYNITDATCKAISKLTNLQILDLEEDFRITKAGLQELLSLSSLRHLTLKGVSVDPSFLDTFKNRNPQCVVVSG